MYDVAIIGGGPAGLSAAIYAVRYKLKAIVFDSHVGGMIIDAHIVENYPGFKSITGFELMQKFQEQAKYLGVEFVGSDVKSLEKGFKITADTTYEAKSIILANGTKKRPLGIPEESDYMGKGVSYCYTCDGAFYKDKIVAVIGGGNASLLATILLSSFAKKAYHIYRGSKLKGEPVNADKVTSKDNVEVIYEANVKKIEGDPFVESIDLDNGRKITVDGIFVEIGTVPSNRLAKEVGVALDEKGYIIVDVGQKTNVEGIYAAGDITTGSNHFRQVLTAVSEGSIAANSVFKELQRH